jgi:hypothetical protein
MNKADTVKAVTQYFRKVGRLGGKARAAAFSTAQIRKWGKMGGRPRKAQARRKAKVN